MKILKIDYDTSYSGGCETCDYGSSCVQDLTITFENEPKLIVKTDTMYDYAFSESDLMILLANAKTSLEIENGIRQLVSNPNLVTIERV